jgi:putative tryptophan/tyrosine transport system substrate-binding protein
MRRRKFLALAGGTAATWPLRLSAQSDRMRRICVLMGLAENDPVQPLIVSTFNKALADLGWREGQNVRIDYRWGAGDTEKIQIAARIFVEQDPDVIVGHTAPVITALKTQTRTIPIIFAQVLDPLGNHFVESLAHPGGNITGFTNLEPSMGPKLLQLLKEVIPHINHVALMFNPVAAPGGGAFFLKPTETASPLLDVTVSPAPVSNPAEIEAVMAQLAHEPNTGLLVMPDVFIMAHRPEIIALAQKYRVPAVYTYRLFPAAGGLMSYGTDLFDLSRRVALYVDRVLKGEKPADLPVQMPTKYELVINLKTANALGLEIPSSVLQRADVVIE